MPSWLTASPGELAGSRFCRLSHNGDRNIIDVLASLLTLHHQISNFKNIHCAPDIFRHVDTPTKLSFRLETIR